MKHLSHFFCYLGITCALGLISSCGTKSTVEKLPPFSVTNFVVGGNLKEAIYITNGMSLYFTRSDVVIWFSEDSAISVEFDPKTLKPLNILLKKSASTTHPAESILDINADGVPEIRKVKGETRNEILYRGEWYTKHNEGTNSIITVDGSEILVRFDGRRWVKLDEK